MKSKQDTEALRTAREGQGRAPQARAALATLQLLRVSEFSNGVSSCSSASCFRPLLSCCSHGRPRHPAALPAGPVVALLLDLGAGCGSCWGPGSRCHVVGAAESSFHLTNIYQEPGSVLGPGQSRGPGRGPAFREGDRQ